MEAEELDGSSSSTLVAEIAINGDIVLIVGPEKKKLQVNSHILKNASKVFRAMFGPYFSEGQDISGNSPKEIPMPDDDAVALEIVCRILHLRNDSLPDSLTPSEILNIAVVADKFDCTVGLKFHTSYWLIPGKRQDILDLGRLAAAAYILDNPRAFTRLTFTMAFCSNESYIQVGDELGDLVPGKIFWLLEERRTGLRIRLEQIIMEGVWYSESEEDHLIYGGHEWIHVHCDWENRHTRAYIVLLRGAGLFPFATSNMTMSEAIDALQSMGDVTIPEADMEDCSHEHIRPDYREMRADDLAAFKNSIGLCLDCVKSGRTEAIPDCRIQH